MGLYSEARGIILVDGFHMKDTCVLVRGVRTRRREKRVELRSTVIGIDLAAVTDSFEIGADVGVPKL